MTGPMFRYDRPQAGRYRQFWQFDVEAIGDPGPAVDAEIIELGAPLLRAMPGVDGVEVLLNSIGDPACRPAYVAELTAYFRGHVDRAAARSSATGSSATRCACSTRRTRRWPRSTPARPRITDRLCDACAAHFAAVRAHLDALGVPYRLEPGLVRGLDYYTRTAFEFYVAGREGQQQALGGGGRYDGLVELLGGRPTPGIGFGLGLDRLILALEEQGAAAAAEPRPRSPSSSVPIRTTRSSRLRIATDLRAAGLAARAELGRRKLGKQLEARRPASGAHFAVIVGDELADGEVQLRDLPAGTQKVVALADLAKELERDAKSHRHGDAERRPDRDRR